MAFHPISAYYRSFSSSDTDSSVVSFSNATSSVSTVDVSFRGITDLTVIATERSDSDADNVRKLIVHHNMLSTVSTAIANFRFLTTLDLSNNQISVLPDELCQLSHLEVLLAKNNLLEVSSIPKSFAMLKELEVLNFGGNYFDQIPDCIYELVKLKAIHFGGNRIENLSCRIGDMPRIEVMYLGGNLITDVPATIGKLSQLTSLVLSDNQLETIPSTIADLQKLVSLSLHNNLLKTLPVEIVRLRNLKEISLRGNPLVAQFVREMTFDPPSLKELSGRTCKAAKMSIDQNDMPDSLHQYLSSAHQCVNPKCKGVYFEARIEHVKFVDFCGKYRVPLLQYLCSPRCTQSHAHGAGVFSSGEDTDVNSDDEREPVPLSRLQKVLLG